MTEEIDKEQLKQLKIDQVSILKTYEELAQEDETFEKFLETVHRKIGQILRRLRKRRK